MTSAEELLSLFANEETGERGYLITAPGDQPDHSFPTEGRERAPRHG